MSGAVQHPSAPEPAKIVAEMESYITEAEGCANAMRKLIEYVGHPIPEANRDLREVMSWVQEDLDSAVIEAQRRWNELHEAITGGQG